MNLESLIRTIKYYRKLILVTLLVTVSAVLLASVAWLALFPAYEGHAEILIFPTNVELNLSQDVSSIVNAPPAAAITQTYSDVALSRNFARKTVQSLWNEQFSRPRPLTLVKRFYTACVSPLWNAALRIFYILNYGKFVDISTFDYYVNKLIERTAITPEPGSYMVNIDVIWDDPHVAASAANKIASLYIRQSLEDNRFAALQVRKFIGRKIGQTQADLDRINQAILKYKEQETIISLPEQGSSLVQNIATYEDKLNDIHIKIAALRAKKANLERNLAKMDQRIVAATVIANNPVIQELEKTLADKEIKLTSLLEEYKNYNGGSKVIEDLKREISNTKKEIGTRTKEIFSQESEEINPVYQDTGKEVIFINAEITSLMSKAKETEMALAAYKDKGRDIPHQEDEINDLLRQKGVAEASLALLNQKYQEARIAQIAKLSSIRIKDAAVPPLYPKYPMVLLNLLLALPMGLFISLFTITFNECRNTRIRHMDDIELITDIPVIGELPGKTSLPANYRIPQLTVNNDTLPCRPAAIDTYLQPFSISIKHAVATGTAKSFLFIGATQDTPKAAIIASIAEDISGAGKRVLVVDANFLSPQLGPIFNVRRNGIPPLREALINGVPYRQAVYRVNPNLDIMLGEGAQSHQGPVRKGPPVELGHLSAVIRQAALDYQAVLVDSTPLLDGIGADLLLESADRIIPVVKSGSLTRQEFMAAIERFRNVRKNILGIVVTG